MISEVPGGLEEMLLLLQARVNTHLSLSVSLSVLLHRCILSCSHTPPLLTFYDGNWIAGTGAGLVDVVELHPLHVFPHKELISMSWLEYLTVLIYTLQSSSAGVSRCHCVCAVYFPKRSRQRTGLRERARVSVQMPAS